MIRKERKAISAISRDNCLNFMNLKQVLKGLNTLEIIGDTEKKISSVQNNSKQIQNNDLFVAIIGENLDGHIFIDSAIQSGATAIIHSKEIHNKQQNVTYIKVEDTKEALSVVANNLYGSPSEQLKVIGVTGTNGKTTTTTLIYEMLMQLNEKAGLIGTIHNKIGEKTLETENTTPLAHELQHLFYQMKEEQVTHVAMEVSSHALDLKRTMHVDFDIAIFTNLTQDHLDFHHTMENYKTSKMKLFTALKENKLAIINQDDPFASEFINSTKAKVVTYGIKKDADITAKNIALTSKGMKFDVLYNGETTTFETKLIGLFNIYNLLAAISALLFMGYSAEQIKEAVSLIQGIPGRMETVENSLDITIIIDFAHTPDALENVLTAIQEFSNNRIITLVGCGGDRDRTKRPLMAAVAEKYSHIPIFTSDNPRTEDVHQIIEDMLQGVNDKEKVTVIPDRKEAIAHAISIAEKEDIILIAGKGHEDYQIIGHTKYNFSDKLVTEELLEKELIEKQS